MGKSILEGIEALLKVAPKAAQEEVARQARGKKHFPIEGYHGTRADFGEFERGDLGFHFGTAEQANNRLRATAKTAEDPYGEQVIPLRASIRNPLEMRDVGAWGDPIQLSAELRAGPAKLKFKQDQLDALRQIRDEALELRGQFESGQDYIDDMATQSLVRDIRNIIADAGFDGVKYKNQVENTYGELPGLTPRAESLMRRIEAEKTSRARQVLSRGEKAPDPATATEDEVSRFLSAPRPTPTPEEQARFDALNRRAEIVRQAGRNDPHSYIAFEPQQLRSRHAQFDEKKLDSGDLLAGVGAGGAVVLGAGEVEGFADGGLAGYDKGGVAKKGAGAVTRAARKAAKPDDLARATILKGVGEDTLFGRMLPTTIDDTLYEMDRAYPGLIKNWEETVARSKATGDEHGFYTSAPGKPTTIMRGDDRSMPPEYTDELMRLAVPAPNGIAFDLHTHPRNTALPSLGDFKVESAVADGSFQHGVTRKSPFPFMSGIEAVAPKSASRRLNIVDARLANASQRRDLSDIIADHLNDDPDFFKRINASKDLTEIMGGMPDHKLISAKEWFANNALAPILTERALARQGRGFNLVEFGPETPMFNVQRKGRDVPATRPGEAADTLRQLDLFVKNKVGYADGGAARFDPEGEGYDDEGAARAGMQPDAEGHMGSVAPTDERDVYRMLKGRAHPTWDKGVAAENMRGSEVVRREDGRYYSVPYAPGGGYADGAHMSDAEMDRMRARALAGRRGTPDLSGATRVDPTLMGGLRRLGADLPAMARDVPGATEMIGSGLARFGGALYDELGDWAADYGQRMYDDPLTTLSGSVRDISETLLPTTTLNRLADVATGVEGAEMPGLMELGEDALTLTGYKAGRAALGALARSRALPAAIGAGVVAAPSEAEAGPKLKTMARIADEARAASRPMGPLVGNANREIVGLYPKGMASPEAISEAAKSSGDLTYAKLGQLYKDLGLTGYEPSSIAADSLRPPPKSVIDAAVASKLADQKIIFKAGQEGPVTVRGKEMSARDALFKDVHPKYRLPSFEAADADTTAKSIAREVSKAERSVEKEHQTGASVLYDVSDALRQRPNTPQFDLPRALPEASDRLSRLDALGAKRLAGYVDQGEGRIGGWYNLDQLRSDYRQAFGQKEGDERFRLWTQLNAGTSMTNPIESNIRTASWYQKQMAAGEPLPMGLSVKDPDTGRTVRTIAGAPPAPYGAKAQVQHAERVRDFLSGEIDPVNNPKPFSYAQNLSGNWSPITADTHYIRDVVGPARYDAFGENSSLNPREYSYLEKLGKGVARERGLSPASMQALAWTGGGKDTGLKSEAIPYMEALQKRILITSKITGLPPDVVREQLVRGQISLYADGGKAQASELSTLERIDALLGAA